MDNRPVIGLSARTLGLRASGQIRPVETAARAYFEAFEAHGALAILLPNAADPELAEAYLSHVDGLVLTGGDDPHPHLFNEEPHPKIELVDERRDHFEIALARTAHAADLPVFGICRGIQLMNIALGGDIFQDIASQTESAVCHNQQTAADGPWHEVEVEEGSALHRIVERARLRVNSFHHQACRRLGEGLETCARTAGDGLIEGIEDPQRRFFVGVQWHPELELENPDGGAKQLFAAFMEAARERATLSSKGRREALSGR